MKLINTPISIRQRALFIYTKSKLNCETFIYIYKIQTLCRQQDDFRCIFIHQKPDTLLYALFYFKKMILAFMYIQKVRLFELPDVFIYKNAGHFEKSETIRVTFL